MVLRLSIELLLRLSEAMISSGCDALEDELDAIIAVLHALSRVQVVGRVVNIVQYRMYQQTT